MISLRFSVSACCPFRTLNWLSSPQCFPPDDYACWFRVLLFIGFMRLTVNSWVHCVSQWTFSSFSFNPLNSASLNLTAWQALALAHLFTLSVRLVKTWTTNHEVIITERSWWWVCWLWLREQGFLDVHLPQKVGGLTSSESLTVFFTDTMERQ